MKQSLSPLVVLAILVGCFDFLAIPMIAISGPGRGVLIGLVAVGVIGAQVSLVATWGVFSSAHFMRRLGISAATGLMYYGCFALGILTASSLVADGPPAVIIFVALTACPLGFFAVQLPPWAARAWLRWEIAKPDQPTSGSYRYPIRIKDLILGTTAVCVASALAKLGPRVLPEDAESDDILTAFAVISTIAAVASLLTVLPLIYFTLGTRHITTGAIGVAVWYGIGIATLVTIVAFGDSRVLTPGEFSACLLVTGSFTVVMCASLLLVRRNGYRLRRLRRSGD